MKVVHISTYINGGAGISAYRIHEALLNNQVDSFFLCIDKPQDKNANKYTQVTLPHRSRINRYSRRILSILKKVYTRRNYDQEISIETELKNIRPSLDCEITTLPFSAYRLHEHPLVMQADIIHLHWISGFVDYPSFFKNIRKPLVWTLHDMNPFKGLFHYHEDEIRNASIAHNLNNAVVALKEKVLEKRRSQLYFVTPSNWLLREAKNSNVFNSIPGFTIPYPIDSALFNKTEKEDLRTRLKIPAKNIIFLFIACSVNTRRKGFDILMEVLNKLDAKITLLVIGNSDNIQVEGIDIRRLGTISDNEILRDYYSLADAFIIPSREDNLPNVMLESFACGTPVISFNVGGLAEMVEDNLNGLKAKEINSIELKHTMLEFIKNKANFKSDKIRAFALERFSAKLIASQYMKVYNRALAASSNQEDIVQ